jgi:serine/threonine protein kinase
MTELVAGRRIGRFRIERPLAHGDVVRVFRAIDEETGTPVALKVVQPGVRDPEVHRRFEREARVAGRVRHPHLVGVLESGRADDVPYMAMAFVPGRTLAETIGTDGPLSLTETARLVEEVGSALDALHRAGIMHRDLRSSNILLDGEGRATLTDFGFARSSADTRITELARPVGTLDYRAPELFRGRPAERASDVYSLGCVAYECVVGIPPFADRGDFLELGRSHLEDRPPPIGPRRPGIPEAYERSILTALDKDARRRPPSGAAYAKLLRFALP